MGIPCINGMYPLDEDDCLQAEHENHAMEFDRKKHDLVKAITALSRDCMHLEKLVEEEHLEDAVFEISHYLLVDVKTLLNDTERLADERP